jgi:hypothetical protein
MIGSGRSMARTRFAVQYLGYVAASFGLLAIAGLGYLAFLAFVKGILMPGEFAAYGLALATVAGATASFFSPCAFTVFPSFILFNSPSQPGKTEGRIPRALITGATAAIGVLTTVIIIGIVIGAVGTSLGPSFSMFSSSPNSAVGKGVRIAIGAFVAAMALLHLLNQSHRIPVLGKVAAWAANLGGSPSPSLRSAYVYGATYVAVGFG